MPIHTGTVSCDACMQEGPYTYSFLGIETDFVSLGSWIASNRWTGFAILTMFQEAGADVDKVGNDRNPALVRPKANGAHHLGVRHVVRRVLGALDIGTSAPG